MKNTVAFGLAELVGQDLLGNVGKLPADFGKAAWTEGEMPKDLHFPFAGKDVDGSLYRTAMMVFHG